MPLISITSFQYPLHGVLRTGRFHLTGNLKSRLPLGYAIQCSVDKVVVRAIVEQTAAFLENVF
jgi:hypothetical protein